MSVSKVVEITDTIYHSRELRNGAEKMTKIRKKNRKNSILVFKGLF